MLVKMPPPTPPSAHSSCVYSLACQLAVLFLPRAQTKQQRCPKVLHCLNASCNMNRGSPLPTRRPPPPPAHSNCVYSVAWQVTLSPGLSQCSSSAPKCCKTLHVIYEGWYAFVTVNTPPCADPPPPSSLEVCNLAWQVTVGFLSRTQTMQQHCPKVSHNASRDN